MDNTNQITNNKIFNNFSKDELSFLLNIIEQKHFSPGEAILTQGEKKGALYFILSGTVNIIINQHGKEYTVTTVSEKETFGEMSFIDDKPISANVKALDSVICLVVYKEKLINNTSSISKSILLKLISNISTVTIDRLRNTNTKYTNIMVQMDKLSKIRKSFGKVFVFAISIMAISSLIVAVLKQYLPNLSIHSDAVNWTYILVLFTPSLLLINSGYKLKTFGIRKKNIWKATKIGLLVSFSIMLILISITYINTTIIGKKPFSSILHLSYITRFSMIFYVIHSAIQEFIYRGVILGALIQFFDDKKGYSSLIISSIMFGIMHTFFGVQTVFVTFISGIIFGYVYIKAKNLIAPTIVHTILGVTSFVLGIV